MKRRTVSLLATARRDLAELTQMLAGSASSQVAHLYISLIIERFYTLEYGAERGSVRDAKTKIRLIGILPSARIAFIVDDDTVSIHRVLYGGQDF